MFIIVGINKYTNDVLLCMDFFIRLVFLNANLTRYSPFDGCGGYPSDGKIGGRYLNRCSIQRRIGNVCQ